MTDINAKWIVEAIDRNTKAIEALVEAQKPRLQGEPDRNENETPQSVATLCEAVAGFLDRHDRFNISDENEDVTHTAGYWIEQMRHTLTAERKRAVLVDKVIQAARSQLSPGIMDAPCGCPCCESIAALDAFDKGAENG